MSDDLADELRAFEGSDALGNGDFSVCVRGATEIARLRAAINDALTAPFSDPELNGTWHQEPIGPNETPEEAVKRLVSVRAEWAVYKNNCENPVIAELRAALATARREGMEAVNALAKLEVWAKKGKVEIARSLLGKGYEVGHLATNSVGVGETVRDAISATAKEVKP